jgi:predicted RNA binding protein YcfA (HicA-like mRNA interferase family)
MSSKPIKRKVWVDWLKSRGFKHIRTEASHEIWDHPTDPLNRPIVFRTVGKEIPAFHVDTCLKTIGVTYKDFIKEAK